MKTFKEWTAEQKKEHVYGYCPFCKAPGVKRERRIDGDDTCEKGHVYPSKDAVYEE